MKPCGAAKLGSVTPWSVCARCWEPPLISLQKSEAALFFAPCTLVLLLIVCPHWRIHNNSKQPGWGRLLMCVLNWGKKTKPSGHRWKATPPHRNVCCVPSVAFGYAFLFRRPVRFHCIAWFDVNPAAKYTKVPLYSHRLFCPFWATVESWGFDMVNSLMRIHSLYSYKRLSLRSHKHKS